MADDKITDNTSGSTEIDVSLMEAEVPLDQPMSVSVNDSNGVTSSIRDGTGDDYKGDALEKATELDQSPLEVAMDSIVRKIATVKTNFAYIKWGELDTFF